MKNTSDDPLAVLLLIDSICLNAKEYSFLMNFYREYENKKRLDMLPNFLFSSALASLMLSTIKGENSTVRKNDAEKFVCDK
jgi:hypothetical protein